MTDILSVSIPDGLREALDAEAGRQGRTRSHLVSEAVKAYLTRSDQDAFAVARDRNLREALALSPEERVHLSEELWWEFARLRPQRSAFVASFETLEEYERWRQVPAKALR